MTQTIAPAALQPAIDEISRARPISDLTITAIQQVPELLAASEHDIRWAATAAAIRLHARALSIANSKPAAVLGALRRLATLTGVDADRLVLLWSGLRYLTMDGSTITAVDQNCLIASAMLEAAGLRPDTLAAAPDAVAESAAGCKFALVPASTPSDPATAAFRLGAHAARFSGGAATTPTPTADSDAALTALLTKAATTPAGASGRLACPPLDVQSKPLTAKPIRDELFEPYQPQRLHIPGAVPHPTDLVESAALATVPPPAPTYRPCLPLRLVTSGILSIAQLEPIVYAGQAHSVYLDADPDSSTRPAPRQGYYIGDGTGVGKGREISGIILDNFNQGRTKAVWFSEKNRLATDARRDWVALDGAGGDIFHQNSFKANDRIVDRDGILFSTYALIRGDGESNRRLDQIVQWLGVAFDGVIVFDEVQNARNAEDEIIKEAGTSRQASLQGQAVVELQHRLPHARIVYVSATGALSPQDFGYAPRLGLWGKGTPFFSVYEFCSAMTRGGLAALEITCASMKSLGLYNSRTLSFEGIQYDKLEHQLTNAQITEHDTIAATWRRLEVSIRQRQNTMAAQVAQIARDKGLSMPKRTIDMNPAIYNGARERFYTAYHAALALPTLIDHIQKALANNMACVVQIANTFAANFERALKAHDPAAGDDAIDMTPRDIPLHYLKHYFPVYQVDVVRVPNGKGGHMNVCELKKDRLGNLIVDPHAAAERDALIKIFDELSIPEGPLEALMRVFGTRNVAEVTGRPQRLVTKDGLGTAFGGTAQKMIEERNPDSNANEIDQFQNGHKRILIYSTASGGAGGSYHSDKSVRNRHRRYHYILQPGNNAIQAMQGLGRSNRTNQANKPHYWLVHTNLASQRKPISRIAKRLSQLGALTLGQRQTTSTLFDSSDNMETKHARQGWKNMILQIHGGLRNNINMDDLQNETNLRFVDETGALVDEEMRPSIDRFLGRLYSCDAARQNELYNILAEGIENALLEDVKTSQADFGVSTIIAKSIVKVDDRVIYTDPRTGASVRYVQLIRLEDSNTIPFSKAVLSRQSVQTGFYRSRFTNTPHVVHHLSDGTYEDVTPTSREIKSWHMMCSQFLSNADRDQVKGLWEAALSAARNRTRESDMHLVCGTLIKVWDATDAGDPRVVRVRTDDGENILGRLMPEDRIENILQAVSAKESGSVISNDAALSALQLDQMVALANGWKIRNWWHNSIKALEIVVNGEYARAQAELTPLGVIVDRMEGFTPPCRFYLPNDATERLHTLERLTKRHPIAGLIA